jgi:hypothetical protein
MKGSRGARRAREAVARMNFAGAEERGLDSAWGEEAVRGGDVCGGRWGIAGVVRV